MKFLDELTQFMKQSDTTPMVIDEINNTIIESLSHKGKNNG